VLLSLTLLFLALAPGYAQAQLDDPTRPPGYRLVLPGGKKAGTNGASFSLSSVFISSTKRAAVINRHTVEAGEYVDGAKVIAIEPSAVKLEHQGKIFTVRLLSQVVKKTRPQ
jgi:hypothetical protein